MGGASVDAVQIYCLLAKYYLWPVINLAFVQQIRRAVESRPILWQSTAPGDALWINTIFRACVVGKRLQHARAWFMAGDVNTSNTSLQQT